MRAAAMSVWIFINLVCFGMCGYIYLIWSQYWMYIEKQRYFTKPIIKPEIIVETNNNEVYSDSINSDGYSIQTFATNIDDSVKYTTPSSRKSARSAVGAASNNRPQSSNVQSRPSTNNVVRKANGRPRFPNVHKPILEFDSDKFICDDLTDVECQAKTAEFKELILKEFHRVLMDESNVFKSGVDAQNPYNVHYNVSKFGSFREKTREELLCEMKNIPVRTITASDEPFTSKDFEKINNINILQSQHFFNTCAVVTSAGALYGSGLGSFIDSHDMVLRFNNAPTENFTEDVGSKTTFRVINSQVVAKKEFDFLLEPLYRNISILAWDPANYTSTLQQWYSKPDFDLFTAYKRFLQENPRADMHILHPRVLWALWDFLQSNSPYRLRKNPPSSGFLGLWFSLWRCERVRMLEFVPSARATRRCHYHAARTDAGCTLGAWHPLAQEKALAERVRHNSDLDVFQRGYIDVPGLRTLQC